MSDKRPLKVLLITPDYPPSLGGIQRLLGRITESVPDADVHVASIRSDGATEFDHSSEQTFSRYWAPRRPAPVRGAVFNLTLCLRSPRFVPDVILNGHVVTSPAAMVMAKRWRVPTVLYTYGKELDGRPKMAAWALKQSDAAIAISEFTREKLSSVSSSGLSTTPIHIVNPGVDAPDAVTRSPSQRPTIVTISRMRDWYKGHDVLVDCLPDVRERIPNVHWVVIGDGRLKKELQLRVEARGLVDNVSFLGSVSDEVRDSWLSAADVFAMPSRYPASGVGGEGFGMVYLEAAVWGVPSLASSVGAPTEVVSHNETGVLVNPEDRLEITEALCSLLRDREWTSRLGENARERALREFSWHTAGQKLRGVLDSVI